MDHDAALDCRLAVPAASGAVGRDAWVALALLTAAYTISFVDRTAVSVVQDRIKAELLLTDWQIGLMIGPAFAIVYSLAGLPLARLAERRDRVRLLAWCVGVWSIMAMACGQARSFAGLFIARMGVGIGEAGGNPASHSLIAEYFPETRRSTAIAIYTLGAPLGAFLGAAGTGWLAGQMGWRNAFLMLGIPGFVLVALILLWLRDPTRAAGKVAVLGKAAAIPSFGAVAGKLVRNSAFRHLVWGGSLVVLVGYCLAAFLPALLVRSYGLPLAQVGLLTGLVGGLGGGIGTLVGGFLGDRWAMGRPARLAMLAALAVLPAPALIAGGILSHDLHLAVAGCFFGMIAIYGYVAPAFAQVHALAEERSRATVTSIYYLVTNLVGLGIGPPLLGALSDFWARGRLGLDSAGFVRACLTQGTTPQSGCAPAMAHGMEMALVAMSLLPLAAAVHFMLVARRYRQQSA
ncbi:MFS family permease [Novosphingobium hassiacum]|uniref:MFS family permease n=1 Tax=Novosphingobium hassiacum TaxID=173676 RepID=A0A7W5ZVD8_9SPHN|nr:MFS transporter [Novosphingobium hassiacum]MBB3860186.1 MFS family permease [Novosphingobium hassiacum]